MASSDVIINIRERGGRQTGNEVQRVGRNVGNLGTNARKAAAHTTLLGKATRSLTKPFRHLSEEAVGLGKTLLGAGIAFGSVEGIKRSIETTDELVKSTVQLHNQFGLTTQSASGLAGVLQTRGISPMALRMGFVTLSKAMRGAQQGNKQLRGDFKLMGLSTKDLHRSLGTEDGLSTVFETLTERLTKMHGSAKKAALGQDLLGRASRGLAPLMQEGALGLRQQLKWAKEFGVTLDGHTIRSVEDMAAAQTKAQYAALGMQIQFGQLLAPTLTKVNLTFASVVKSFRDGRPEGNKYARTIYRIGQDLKPVGKDLAKVGGFLKDHPRLLKAAAFAFVGYKLKLFSLLGYAGRAYAAGLASGRAYEAGMTTGMTEGAAAGGSRFAMLGTTIGRFIGPALGVAALGFLTKKLIDLPSDLMGDLISSNQRVDRDPDVRASRAWARFSGKHHLQKKFLRRNPQAGRVENLLLGIDSGPLLHGAAGRYQARRSHDLEAYLRSIGDPMFTPRSGAALRQTAANFHITLKMPDGQVLLKTIERAAADKQARR